MRDSSYIIARLNRRYYVAKIVGWAKGTAIVLLGVSSWAVLVGLINHIR